MLTFDERKELLAVQLTEWRGFIDHYYGVYMGGLQGRISADDLVTELYLVGHKLLLEERHPFEDAPLFKTAYVHRIQDIIDHHKARCRDYHRDLTNFAVASGNDDVKDAFETLDPNDVVQAEGSSDIDEIDLWNDAASPLEMAELRDSIEAIGHKLSADGSVVWDALINVKADLHQRWETRKAEQKAIGKSVRTDGRTLHGLPWLIWSEHLGWSVNRIKDAVREIRTVTAKTLGYRAVFAAGLSTYAHLQIPDDMTLKG